MLLTNYGGYYSLGWALYEGNWAGGDAYGHAGSNGTYYAYAWMVPSLNYAVMVVANAGGSNTGIAAGMTLHEFLFFKKLEWVACTAELVMSYGLAASALTVILLNGVTLLYLSVRSKQAQ